MNTCCTKILIREHKVKQCHDILTYNEYVLYKDTN